MQVVNFYPKTFHEIPKQDNPAFDPPEPCVMIVKDFESPKAIVLHIQPDPDETVTHIAAFWRADLAAHYANTLAFA